MRVELRLLATVLVAALFGATGFMCLFQPHRIQRYAIAVSQRQRFNPFKRHIASKSYVWELRVVGVLCLPCCLVATLFALEIRFGADWYTRDICATSQIAPMDFFSLGTDQQVLDFKKYNLGTQYCLYIYGMTGIEPPTMGLEKSFAEGGAQTVQLIKAKLPTASQYFVCPPIVYLLSEVNRLGTYDLVHDSQLLAEVRQRVEEMDDALWKQDCEKKLSDLKSTSHSAGSNGSWRSQ
jgi:hypothetical protein